MKYYFASKHCFDEDILTPYIPQHKYNHEDDSTNRICVSQSIHGCLSAIGMRFEIGDKIYIHECESDYAMQPTTGQVVDVCLTGEQWLLKPVKMKLFMKIVITNLMTMTLGKMDSIICAFELINDKENY